MEFLDVVKDIEGDVRNAQNIFNAREDGLAVSSTRNRYRGRIDPISYKKNLTEAIKLVESVLTGRRHPYILREVMTTDDFPLYFADILDRTLLATYNTVNVGWTAYAKRATVADFRDAKLIPPMYGLDGPLDEVQQGEPYPDAAIHEQAPITWRVKKYGRRVPFTWETMINDDLDQLKDTPERLARAARRTEHRQVTSVFVGTGGPLSTMYHNNYKNIVNTTNGSPTSVGTNPPLSVNGLQAALIVLTKQRDETGEPILRDMVTLVVPPDLQITAESILNALQINDSTLLGGGQPDNHTTSGERQLVVNNWLRNRFQLVVDPYLPILDESANKTTTWYLFANPNNSREAIRIGFLRGHESPEIWMKSPNAMRVGGGPVSPMSGDFDTDSIEYRIRHVMGVTKVDPKATVVSNGSGS